MRGYFNALVVIILVCWSITLNAQTNQPQTGEQYYVVLLTTGQNWDTTKRANEQPYFKEHSVYLNSLWKNKTISIGGRFSDKGMLILKAKSEEEAAAIIMKDVAIQQKLFDVEIFPYSPFYSGCVEGF